MRHLCLVVVLIIIATPGFGTNIHDDAGTTGAAFLKIEGGNRPVAMGGAFAGLANDINTLFWNPAGLTAISNRELTATQNFAIADISNQSIGYAQRVGRGVWGASFLGAFTEIERRIGRSDEPDSLATVGGFAVGVSYAYALSTELSIGGTAKGISQQLDVEDSLGAAVDIGALYRLSDNRIGVGVAAQNLGMLSTDENLPMNIRGGISYQVRTKRTSGNPISTREQFAVVADVDIPVIGGFPTFHLGAESWFYDMLAVRAGYSVSTGENPKNGLTVGLGLRRRGEGSLADVNFQFDYAFIPDADMGDAHRISFITRF